MQQLYLQKTFYKTRRIDDNVYSAVALERAHKIKVYQQLRAEGCTEATALTAISTPRSTLYRWMKAYKQFGVAGLENGSRKPLQFRTSQWSKHTEQLVLHLRKKFKVWGKLKIATILARDYGMEISVSSVGRIISKLIRKKRIKPVKFYYGRVKRKRVRVFNGYSRRWTKDLKVSQPGDLLQIDHTTVSPNPGRVFKHFKAVCPLTKITIDQVYSRATSKCAAAFLEEVKRRLPFAIRSIQVDGGSEFKADFEDACEDAEIPLYVLPPKSPELNGNVERGNGTVKYEFYAFYDGPMVLDKIRTALMDYCDMYNEYRPHQALHQLTPMAYLKRGFSEVTQSHMC